MRLAGRTAALVLCAAMVFAAGTLTAQAESRRKISRVRVTVTSDIRVGDYGGDAQAQTSTPGCYVDSTEVINDDGEAWTSSRPPVIQIVLVAEDEDAYFSSSSKSSYKLELNSRYFEDITVTDVKREDDNTAAVITARFQSDKSSDDSEDGYAAAPERASWDASRTGAGSWKEAGGAKYYQVQLLKDGSVSGSTVSVYGTSYNFAAMITAPGSYRFRVRAVEAGTNDKSGWTVSDAWTMSQEELRSLQSLAGSWQRSADGTKWWWRRGDGTWPASQWLLINGYYYYFDGNGYMCTGWILLNGTYYYLDNTGVLPEGAMFASRRTPDGYWVDASGAWVPGA